MAADRGELASDWLVVELVLKSGVLAAALPAVAPGDGALSPGAAWCRSNVTRSSSFASSWAARDTWALLPLRLRTETEGTHSFLSRWHLSHLSVSVSTVAYKRTPKHAGRVEPAGRRTAEFKTVPGPMRGNPAHGSPSLGRDRRRGANAIAGRQITLTCIGG